MSDKEKERYRDEAADTKDKDLKYMQDAKDSAKQGLNNMKEKAKEYISKEDQ